MVLCIAEAVEDELFVDEARFDGLLRTTHRIDRIDKSWIRVVYRMEITGTDADEAGPRIGPHITADWPQTWPRPPSRHRRRSPPRALYPFPGRTGAGRLDAAAWSWVCIHRSRCQSWSLARGSAVWAALPSTVEGMTKAQVAEPSSE